MEISQKKKKKKKRQQDILQSPFTTLASQQITLRFAIAVKA